MKDPSPYSWIIEQYGRLAGSYDHRWRTYLRQTHTEALEALRLCGTECVLDVGCGTGEFERMAMERFPRLAMVGVDVAPAMIANARRKLADYQQVSFQLAEAEWLPFDAERFDAVVSVNVLHHVRSPQQMLQAVVRVLRPHGRFVVVDWCLDFWHCRLMHCWLRLTDRSYVTMYRLAEVTAMLEQHAVVTDEARRFLVPPFYGMLRVSANRRLGVHVSRPMGTDTTVPYACR